MIGVGIDLREPAIVDGCDHAAARRAHGAVSVDVLGSDGAISLAVTREITSVVSVRQRRS